MHLGGVDFFVILTYYAFSNLHEFPLVIIDKLLISD